MDNDDFPMFNMGIIDPVVPLLQKSLNGELLSEQELIVLEEWKNQSAENKALFNRLGDPSFLLERLSKWNEIEKGRELNKQRGINMVAATILQSDQPIDQAFHEEQMAPQPFTADIQSAEDPSPVVTPTAIQRTHFLKTAWFRYAAASILLIATAAVFLVVSSDRPTSTSTSASIAKDPEIQPGKKGAILTLADGSQVVLDSLGNGIVAMQNGSKAVIKNGELVYDVTGELTGEVAINTMSTPAGGQYKLTLADGTDVWLNASSSITYPTAFTGKTRAVSVSGEAYFEVAKNHSQPFIVKTNNDEIVVLGTSFNINSYPDEQANKTSLAEGAIKVNNKILQPGEAYSNGKIEKTDIAQDISWKNGVFNFENMSIQQAMNRLARWYNLQIIYEDGKIPDVHFGGKMDMGLKLSQVLEALKESGLHFRIEEGNKLVITQ